MGYPTDQDFEQARREGGPPAYNRRMAALAGATLKFPAPLTPQEAEGILRHAKKKGQRMPVVLRRALEATVAMKPRKIAYKRGMRVWIPGIVTFVRRADNIIYVQSTDPKGQFGDKIDERKPSDHVLNRRFVMPRKRIHGRRED